MITQTIALITIEATVHKNIKTSKGLEECVWKSYRITHSNRDGKGHTAISKNVVGENDEYQLSNGDCTTERKCGY